MYHCYSTNPKAHVYNNESLINDTTGAVERIKNNIQKPCTAEIALETNDKINSYTTKNKPL